MGIEAKVQALNNRSTLQPKACRGGGKLGIQDRGHPNSEITKIKMVQLDTVIFLIVRLLTHDEWI